MQESREGAADPCDHKGTESQGGASTAAPTCISLSHGDSAYGHDECRNRHSGGAWHRGSVCPPTDRGRLHAGAPLAIGSAVEVATVLDGAGVEGSVPNPEDVAALVETTHERTRSDAVVNNTGHPAGELLAMSDEEWHEEVDLVLLNTVRMAASLRPSWKTRMGARA